MVDDRGKMLGGAAAQRARFGKPAERRFELVDERRVGDRPPPAESLVPGDVGVAEGDQRLEQQPVRLGLVEQVREFLPAVRGYLRPGCAQRLERLAQIRCRARELADLLVAVADELIPIARAVEVVRLPRVLPGQDDFVDGTATGEVVGPGPTEELLVGLQRGEGFLHRRGSLGSEQAARITRVEIPGLQVGLERTFRQEAVVDFRAPEAVDLAEPAVQSVLHRIRQHAVPVVKPDVELQAEHGRVIVQAVNQRARALAHAPEQVQRKARRSPKGATFHVDEGDILRQRLVERRQHKPAADSPNGDPRVGRDAAARFQHLADDVHRAGGGIEQHGGVPLIGVVVMAPPVFDNAGVLRPLAQQQRPVGFAAAIRVILGEIERVAVGFRIGFHQRAEAVLIHLVQRRIGWAHMHRMNRAERVAEVGRARGEAGQIGRQHAGLHAQPHFDLARVCVADRFRQHAPGGGEALRGRLHPMKLERGQTRAAAKLVPANRHILHQVRAPVVFPRHKAGLLGGGVAQQFALAPIAEVDPGFVFEPVDLQVVQLELGHLIDHGLDFRQVHHRPAEVAVVLEKAALRIGGLAAHLNRRDRQSRLAGRQHILGEKEGHPQPLQEVVNRVQRGGVVIASQDHGGLGPLAHGPQQEAVFGQTGEIDQLARRQLAGQPVGFGPSDQEERTPARLRRGHHGIIPSGKQLEITAQFTGGVAIDRPGILVDHDLRQRPAFPRQGHRTLPPANSGAESHRPKPNPRQELVSLQHRCLF